MNEGRKQPQCVQLYFNFFATCREPGIVCDRLRRYSPEESRHVVVAHNNQVRRNRALKGGGHVRLLVAYLPFTCRPVTSQPKTTHSGIECHCICHGQDFIIWLCQNWFCVKAEFWVSCSRMCMLCITYIIYKAGIQLCYVVGRCEFFFCVPIMADKR